jgi:alpha-beta hydrolase superfamily lysophospholipase
MLPAAFPAARILGYGYRSDWFGEAALNTRAATIAEGLLDELQTARKDAPARPLIFVAHSFGGLVLMKVSFSYKGLKPIA